MSPRVLAMLQNATLAIAIPGFLMACAPSAPAPPESPSGAAEAAPENVGALPWCAPAPPVEEGVGSLEPKTRSCSFDEAPVVFQPSSTTPPVEGGTADEQMTPPQLLCRPAIHYPERALENKAAGVVRVKCVLDLDGSLCNCRIVKSVPFTDDAILASMGTWKYTPIVFKGRPRRVQTVSPIGR
jgi:TonB family protein